MMRSLVLATFALLAVFQSATWAGDWPMWRFNAARSNAAAEALANRSSIAVGSEWPQPTTAWPASQPKLQFDAHYQPIVAGQLMFVGSTVNDSVTAYDTRTGEVEWTFYTDGPVRFAPVAYEGKLYVASDDGYVYCLKPETGGLIWKRNGGPTERRIIGNERVISSWPIRGGLVVADDTVYFAASIWPFMGIFIHAMDAELGDSIWVNSETGSQWITHPHGAPSFGSIVPQGYLAVAGDHVIVPGGRSLPAVLDRKTGKVRHFQFGGKGSGGWNVAANQTLYAAGSTLLDLRDGTILDGKVTDVLTGRHTY